jgi:hypothetical protein
MQEARPALHAVGKGHADYRHAVDFVDNVHIERAGIGRKD